jgi:hypothetical protein
LVETGVTGTLNGSPEKLPPLKEVGLNAAEPPNKEEAPPNDEGLNADPPIKEEAADELLPPKDESMDEAEALAAPRKADGLVPALPSKLENAPKLEEAKFPAAETAAAPAANPVAAEAAEVEAAVVAALDAFKDA